MKFTGLFKSTIKDFKWFHHDFDHLSSSKKVHYFRPFLLVSITSVIGIQQISDEYPEVRKFIDKVKYEYLDIKLIQ